jgi:hypothetical protein
MMARYSEADDLSAGGRVVSMRVDSDVALVEDELQTPRVIDLRAAQIPEPVLLAEPVSSLPRQERHAVGRTLRVMGHLFDAAALALPLVLSGILIDEPMPVRIIALFALVGTLLLWPTSRRGRLVVVPSEGLLSVVGRIGLAPVVTLIIVSVFGMSHLSVSGRTIDVFAIVQIVAATTPLILLGRLVSYRLVGHARSRGYDLEDTLIVGTGPVGVAVADALQEHPEFGLVPTGFVDRYDDEVPLPIVGRPEHLTEILDRTGARHVILAFGAAGEEELVSIMRRCQTRRSSSTRCPACSSSASPPRTSPTRSPACRSSRCAVRVSRRAPVGQARLRSGRGLGAADHHLAPDARLCRSGEAEQPRGPVFFRQVRIGINGRRSRSSSSAPCGSTTTPPHSGA